MICSSGWWFRTKPQTPTKPWLDPGAGSVRNTCVSNILANFFFAMLSAGWHLGDVRAVQVLQFLSSKKPRCRFLHIFVDCHVGGVFLACYHLGANRNEMLLKSVIVVLLYPIWNVMVMFPTAVRLKDVRLKCVFFIAVCSSLMNHLLQYCMLSLAVQHCSLM